ncbi:MAG: hypothetical protein PHO67_07980 [Candidatus Omnitrophica bacterium]|nr:hypothetical protein [Candidatus Omnitrophota bacterium]
MPAGCPGNSGGGHYWIIDSRTGEAACKYCPLRQKYDIDALIFPDYKGRPREFNGRHERKTLRTTLQFEVDRDMIEALKGLRTSIEEQLNTINHQAQSYREISRKTSDRDIKNKAKVVVKNMELSAGVLAGQMKAVSLIVKGP